MYLCKEQEKKRVKMIFVDIFLVLPKPDWCAVFFFLRFVNTFSLFFFLYL